MSTYRLKVYTGPVGVAGYGRRAKRAKLRVVTTGTSHIYLDVKAPNCDAAEQRMRTALKQKHRTDYRLAVHACTRRPTKGS